MRLLGTTMSLYSEICFQHIAIREVRRRSLKDIEGFLKDEAMESIKIQFFPTCSGESVSEPHTPWSGERAYAISTNSLEDVWLTGDQLRLVWRDFSADFKDLRFQFIDAPRARPAAGTSPFDEPCEHIIITATKRAVLAA
jgi:hypothetical protein